MNLDLFILEKTLLNRGSPSNVDASKILVNVHAQNERDLIAIIIDEFSTLFYYLPQFI